MVSTAVSQWGRTEGPKMMDGGEMKAEGGKGGGGGVII